MLTKDFKIESQKLYEICLGLSSDYEILENNFSKLRIIFKTKTTLLSWGEEITIDIKQITINKSRITVNSDCHSQLIDWGKNSQNEEDFVMKLIKKL